MTSTLVLRILSVLTLLLALAYAMLQKGSIDWPTTMATVQRGAYEQTIFASVKDGRGKVYSVTYAYEVNGRQYTSNRFGWAATSSVVPIFSSMDEKKPHEGQPREGDIIQVSYASWFPALAVVVPGPSPQLWLWFIVASLFAIIFWVFSHLAKHPIF